MSILSGNNSVHAYRMKRHKFRNLKHEFAQESAEAKENEDDKNYFLNGQEEKVDELLHILDAGAD